MKTDLKEVFQQICDTKQNKFNPFTFNQEGNNNLDKYLTALKQSPHSKVHAELRDPNELWKLPSVALLLSDVLIMTGIGGQKTQLKMPQKLSKPITLELPNTVPNTSYTPCFGYFDKSIVEKWISDMKPFIDDGRVVYVPKRFAFRLVEINETGEKRWHGENVDANSPMGFWRVMKEAQETYSAAIIMQEQRYFTNNNCFEMLHVSLPYIHNIPYTLLHKIINEEEDSLICFRSAISKAIKESHDTSRRLDNPDQIKRLGLTIKEDIIDPEIARLNQNLKKIIQTRTIKIAGATLGSIGLAITAFAGHGLETIVSSALGAGGAGLLANQIAEYRNDILSLKDNPWYFAWKLSKFK